MTKPWTPLPVSKPTIVTASAESETLGTRNYAILTMFLSRLNNGGKNSPNRARNADLLSQFKPDRPAATRRVLSSERRRQGLKLFKVWCTSAADAGEFISFTAGLKTCSTPPWDTVKHKKP